MEAERAEINVVSIKTEVAGVARRSG